MKKINFILLKKFGKFLVHCFCPNRCACCGRVIYYDQTLCSSCRDTLPKITGLLCDQCHMPLHQCTCDHNNRTSVPCVSALPYTSIVQEGILTLKKGVTHGVPFFAKILAKEIKSQYKATFNGIVYVPITKKKKRLRGYNQCELLANSLGKELGLPVLHGGLVRLFDTHDLHRSPRTNRKGSVFGVFEAEEKLVAHKTLLLIDDVITTGAPAV